MSNYFNRKPKILRERKTWIKKATAILQSKFRKIKRSRTIRRTVSGVNNTMSSILSRRTRKSRSSKRHHLIFAPPKKPSSSTLRRARTFFPVYVDDLYSIEQKGGLISQVVQKENKNLHAEKASGYSSPSELIGTAVSTTATTCRVRSTDYTGHPPPAVAAASSSLSVDDGKAATADEKLQGVDFKAEMFIARFREEIRLQRQKSFEEYQEMLARGV